LKAACPHAAPSTFKPETSTPAPFRIEGRVPSRGAVPLPPKGRVLTLPRMQRGGDVPGAVPKPFPRR